MLSPRNYLEDCIRFGLPDLWATGMPWKAVSASINVKFDYLVPEEAKTNFRKNTGHTWNNTEDSFLKSLDCPRCSQQLEILWSTCCANDAKSTTESALLEFIILPS